MKNCDKALEAVANGIVKRMERECTAEELLLIAQAAAAITQADKMASGNIVEPIGYTEEMVRGEVLTARVEHKGQIIQTGYINHC